MTIPETIQICQHCGAANSMSFRFCQRCGHALGSAASPPAPPARPDADQGSRTVPPPAPPSPPPPSAPVALYEKGVCLLFLGRFEEAAACIGEVAAIQPGPAVEAARQACLAGLPSHRQASSVGSGTFLGPIDDLDLRT